MAAAKKCDRCGNLYDLYDGIPFNDNRKYHAVKFANCNYNTAWLDLCPDCMKQIILFMENK